MGLRKWEVVMDGQGGTRRNRASGSASSVSQSVVPGEGPGCAVICPRRPLLVGLLVFGIVGCDSGAGVVVVSHIEVTPSSASIMVGTTQQFSATLRDATGKVLGWRPVTWSSSDPGIVSVHGETGVARGVGAGVATITAKSEGISGSVDVTVIAPTGTVAGSVTAEGTGLVGVPVSLVGTATLITSTSADGRYAFLNVETGTYTVSIDASSYSDVVFTASSMSASIIAHGQTFTVNFGGVFLRTAGILGFVTGNGSPLVGVSVSVKGGPDNVSRTTTTGAGGRYAVWGLRAGTYSVVISGFPEHVTFPVTSRSVTVVTGESRSVDFEGSSASPIKGAVSGLE